MSLAFSFGPNSISPRPGILITSRRSASCANRLADSVLSGSNAALTERMLLGLKTIRWGISTP